MAADDQRLRTELASDGSLFGGYHPRMRELHDRNAGRLHEIWTEHGWPTRSLVGVEGAHAAWLILQHAIAQPVLQRAGLAALQLLVESGEVDPVEVAMLHDRICTFEGTPQSFGTQFDWDAEGRMSPLPVDDMALVDMRRQKLGLSTLAAEVARRRAEVDADPNDGPPVNWERYQRARLQWLKQVGWREW